MAIIAFLCSFPPYLSAESEISLLLTTQRNWKGNPNAQPIQAVWVLAVLCALPWQLNQSGGHSLAGQHQLCQAVSHQGLTAGLGLIMPNSGEMAGFWRVLLSLGAEWCRRRGRWLWSLQRFTVPVFPQSGDNPAKGTWCRWGLQKGAQILMLPQSHSWTLLYLKMDEFWSQKCESVWFVWL